MPHLIVNGELIEESLIRAESRNIRQRLIEEMPNAGQLEIDQKAREWGRENVVERVLLRQAAEQSARAAGDEAPDVQHFIAELTKDAPRPTRTEISAIYKKNRSLFHMPEMVHVSHIVKNVDEQTTEAQALANLQLAQQQLGNGRTFEEVANESSDCSGQAGSLGWFARGEMVPEFEAVVFQLRPGEVSDIFRSPFGFHIAKLHARRPEGVRPLSEVYADIEQRLLARNQQTILEAFLDGVRAKADIRTAATTPVAP